MCKEGEEGGLLFFLLYTHTFLLALVPSLPPLLSSIPQIFAKENSGTYNCEWMVIDAAQRSFYVLDQVGGRGEEGGREGESEAHAEAISSDERADKLASYLSDRQPSLRAFPPSLLSFSRPPTR